MPQREIIKSLCHAISTPQLIYENLGTGEKTCVHKSYGRVPFDTITNSVKYFLDRGLKANSSLDIAGSSRLSQTAWGAVCILLFSGQHT